MAAMKSARLIARLSARLFVSVVLIVVGVLVGGCVSETRTLPLPPGTHSMKSVGGSM